MLDVPPRRAYEYRDWRTHQISDHLPMWVEIETDFADAYLASLARIDP